MIRTWRKKRGLSRYALARLARIARQSVTNLEGDPKDGPEFHTVARLWLVLGIPGHALARIIQRHGSRSTSTQMD